MKTKVNIAILIPSLLCGGAERSASLLANCLVETGDYNVIIYTLTKCKPFYSLHLQITVESIDDKVKCINRVFKTTERVKHIRKLNKLYKIDLIIGYSSLSAILACAVCINTDIKCIICERANPENSVKEQKFLRSFLYYRNDGAVFQTKFSRQYFVKKVRDSVIIPNFIESSKLPDIIPYYERNKKIVAVGRLDQGKNHQMLISAFSMISKDISEYYIEIYGDGELYDELNEYIIKLNMQDKIFLMGKTDKVFESIKNAKLFVFTSNSEGFPNALLEAASLGIPCISTDCPAFAPRQIINDLEFGALVALNDDKGLAVEIKKIISANIDEKRLVERTNYIRSKYDIDTLLSEWIEYIEKILYGGRKQ